ncbi:MAG: segregation and condensation protein A [Oscillospiraceae bacterium]|jgi:segregation and condensation protein A
MATVPTYHIEGLIIDKAEARRDFDGPLDLILALLSKNKIEIRDVWLSVILDQYLAWMEERRNLDLEVASEFVIMASHLMYLKTKMLLSAQDEEVLSELELLMKSLEEKKRGEIYSAIRQRAEELASMSEFGRNIFLRLPEPLGRVRRYEYRHDLSDLVSAMREISERSRSALPPPASAFSEVVAPNPYPVRRKITEILTRLIAAGKAKLKSLFQGSSSRSEIVSTFVAILELCSMGAVRIDEDDQVSYIGGEYTENEEVACS